MLKEKISKEDKFAILKAEQKITFPMVVSPAEVVRYDHKDCSILDATPDPYSKYVVEVQDGVLFIEFDGQKLCCDSIHGSFILSEPDGAYECKLFGDKDYTGQLKEGGEFSGKGAIYTVKKTPKIFGEIINTDLEKEYWKMISMLYARFVASNNFDIIPDSEIEFASSIIADEPTYTILDVVHLFKFVTSNLGLMGETIPGRAFNNTLLHKFRTFYNLEKSKALEGLRVKEKSDIQEREKTMIPQTVNEIAKGMDVKPRTWVQKELAKKSAAVEQRLGLMTLDQRAKELQKQKDFHKKYWADVERERKKKQGDSVK